MLEQLHRRARGRRKRRIKTGRAIQKAAVVEPKWPPTGLAAWGEFACALANFLFIFFLGCWMLGCLLKLQRRKEIGVETERQIWRKKKEKEICLFVF